MPSKACNKQWSNNAIPSSPHAPPNQTIEQRMTYNPQAADRKVEQELKYKPSPTLKHKDKA
jgi:hypothetical protein